MNDELEPPKVDIVAILPADWVEKLKELATKTGGCEADLIEDAIGLYLEKINMLVERVIALEGNLDGFNDFNNNGTVDTGVSLELIKKLEQFIEIAQTPNFILLVQGTDLSNFD